MQMRLGSRQPVIGGFLALLIVIACGVNEDNRYKHDKTYGQPPVEEQENEVLVPEVSSHPRVEPDVAGTTLDPVPQDPNQVVYRPFYKGKMLPQTLRLLKQEMNPDGTTVAEEVDPSTIRHFAALLGFFEKSEPTELTIEQTLGDEERGSEFRQRIQSPTDASALRIIFGEPSDSRSQSF